MSALSDIIGGSFQMTAGAAAINQNDLVQTTTDGKAYTVHTADYASIGNAATAVALTSIGNNPSIEAYGGYFQNVIASDGSIYTVAAHAGSTQGLQIFRYSAAGALLQSVVVDSSSTIDWSPQLALLSNGNIVVSYQPSATSQYFAIYTNFLTPIVAPTSTGDTTISSTPNTPNLTALSGGGFALTYVLSTYYLRLAIYSNTGAVVLTPTTISNQYSSDAIYNKTTQLSNGNILVAFEVSTANVGFFAIYSPAGAVVQANTAFPTAPYNVTSPLILLSVLPGYFALVWITAAYTIAVAIYSNAGAQQGTTYTVGTAIPTLNIPAIANDGTLFYLVYADSTSTFVTYVKIYITGGASAISTTTTVANTNYGGSGTYVGGLAAAVDFAGNLAVVGNTGNAATMYYFVVNVTTNTIVSASATTGMTPSIGLQSAQLVTFLGDFTVFILGENSTALEFVIFKYANSAIVGIAVSSAAAGALVSVQPNRIGGGTYASVANTIKGTSNKTFNHSATTIYGNNGTLFTNGAILKGM